MSQTVGTEVKTTAFKGKPQQKAWKYIRDNNSVKSDNLNRIAIVTGAKKYTYGLMFRQWERYASVFSALHMTGAEKARVGMMGAVAAETIFTFYGLNMVGAEVSILSSFSGLKPNRITQTIKEEKLTDFIITDDLAQPNLIQELFEKKEALGLRNIIILHVPVCGNSVNSALAAVQEAKYMYLKSWFAPICMDTLLAAYSDYPVSYCSDDGSDIAAIIHTSGTTGGVGKPVVLSDKALNSVGTVFTKTSLAWIPQGELVCALSVDLSNAYSLVDQIHMPLAIGGTIAVVPGGALNPTFYKAIPELKISVLFCISAMFDFWINLPKSTKFDFSSLRCVILGGAAVSAKDKRRFYEFLRANGCGEIPLINGYGISELGGACCLSTPDINDESIGYPLPGVSFRLLDEETNKFQTIKNAPCTGVLYMNSPSITSGYLDGKEICKIETIDGKPYICTNDTVSVDEAGKLTYLGRDNRYFINDSKKKYESGRVETEFSRQEGIENCCIAPLYVKTQHDNVPMLCATTLEKGEASEKIIHDAFVRIFISDKTLNEDSIPCRVLIANELPRNAIGKIDLYAIQQGNVSGKQYQVDTVKRSECVVDFKFTPHEDGPDDMIKGVFKGIASDLKENFSIKNMIGEDDITKKNPFASLNTMNQMAGQMMNMMCMANQPCRQNSNWFSMFQNQMPNQQLMSYMNQINQINQMNQMAWQVAQQRYAQNCQMMSQLWQMFQKAMPNMTEKKQECKATNETADDTIAE